MSTNGSRFKDGNIIVGGGANNELPLAGQTAYYDGAKANTQRTLETWEDKHRELDHERALIVNEDGIAVGYFDGDSGSVHIKFPKGVDKSTLSLTHNHPYGDDRDVGGGFSDADAHLLINQGIREIRAVTGEGTYVLRRTSESNPAGFKVALARRDKEVNAVAKRITEEWRQQGIAVTDRDRFTAYLAAHDAWYQRTANRYGYEYHSPFSDRSVTGRSYQKVNKKAKGAVNPYANFKT